MSLRSPLSRFDEHFDRYAPWVCVLAMLLVVGYGFWAGDLTESEAGLLLRCNERLGTGPRSILSPSDSYSGLLARAFRIGGLDAATPTAARAASAASTAALLLLAVVWCWSRMGIEAAAATALLLAASPAFVIASTQIGSAGWCALGAALIACSIDLTTAFRIRWGKLLASVLAVLGAAILGLAGASVDEGPRSLLEVAWSLLPAVVFVWPTATSGFWAAVRSRNLVGACVSSTSLALLGLIVAMFSSSQALAGVLTANVGLAVAAGIGWRLWTKGELPADAADRASLAHRIAVVGIPFVVLAAACVRLAVCFQFEERYQALAGTAIAAAVLGGVGVALARPLVSFTALFLTAVSFKLIYVHAALPERDLRWSPRADASVVARAMPPNATLYTNFPTSDRFRFYLGAEIQPLSRSKDARRRGLDFLVLASAAEADKLQGRWARVRELEGLPGGRHWLMRPEPPAASADRSRPPH